MALLKSRDIDRIANLSKLIIPKNENDALLESLNKTFDLVIKMDKVDTSAVEPLAHPYNETQPLREDHVTESNQRDLFQKSAPQVEAGLYMVPIVIDNEG
ncbi:Asp-tRNA(Asn)/Glu-tRNA(Gln) amidotransferase subunit GatC [Coxiella endosymbiont of Ornithodoros maritimus]|uniref:Asp-tRNA(Asn)/Glu-tRNA(Gln) amidotransferase subunit GatC n=1 Tax=Coxiella endosymbiont of Ornithodoros maritimus TaxID=1656172 RepID=UPI00226500DC|nr:Asp-tRNA(Asn)/Glu-tRNA(Gln) amidotransferase subunit GatC [Coxiella endosymbiont of Ornithodoros maritimus]